MLTWFFMRNEKYELLVIRIGPAAAGTFQHLGHQQQHYQRELVAPCLELKTNEYITALSHANPCTIKSKCHRNNTKKRAVLPAASDITDPTAICRWLHQTS